MTGALISYFALAIVFLAAAHFEASYTIQMADVAMRRRLLVASRAVSLLIAAAAMGIVFLSTQPA